MNLSHCVGRTRSGRWWLPVLLALAGEAGVRAGEHHSARAWKAVIADGGLARMPVVVPTNATADVRRCAGELAGLLSRMSGAAINVVTGDGATGVAVGTIRDYPALRFRPAFDLGDAAERQGYEIRSHRRGVCVIGATEQAVGYAVYDFLYRLGYRRYFPSPAWEIVPVRLRLEFAGHIRETPDFLTRTIWFSMGVWPEYGADLARWNTANRNGGYPLNIAHMYQRIIAENRAEFDRHPDYLGLVGGRRTSSKFCIANPDLRRLVAAYALGQFEKFPALECFSAEASDGGGWCECEACAKLGTPSTRVVTLANAVADAVRERYPNRRVGILAYGYHSPPPDIDVASNVIVCAAAGFIRGGHTLDTMLDGWRGRKAELGVYEYYDVFLWSANLPGLSRAGNLDYLHTTIPKFHDKGVRHVVAEASDSWGPNGLGYYLAERMLWNTGECRALEALVQDFLDASFGPAAPAMKEFYGLLDGSRPRLLCADLLGRMYRQLDRATRAAAGSPGILRRIDDLALYTRFCELHWTYSQAPADRRRAAYERLMEFIASIRGTRMMHSKAFFQDRRLFPEKVDKAPGDWKTPRGYTTEEVAGIISNGIAANPLLDFEAVRFSDDLVPAPALAREPFRGGGSKERLGNLTLHLWAADPPAPLELTVTGGLIAWYRDRGNVRCDLWKVGGASEEGDRESLVQSDASVPPDGTSRVVRLTFKQPGLHKAVIADGGDLTRVEWPRGSKVTVVSDPAALQAVSGTFCFYVPRGARRLGFVCDAGSGDIVAPDGKPAFRFNRTRGYYSVAVGEGQDGKLWTLRLMGRIGFMTVPPCLATEPSGLLLPAEVVKADGLGRDPL